MLNARIWDKTSPINGVDAEKILQANSSIQREECVFLVYNESIPNTIQRIELMSVIRSNNGWGSDYTNEEVISMYLQKANAPAPDPETSLSDTELTILEGQTSIYEQNLQILNKLETTNA